ncbi:MAG: hypothetical protein PWP45_591 [Tepidanaerobacteraceae bacterium]|nr:hypothetical protein [Tepidanaerobacteraceae bacterium]
MNQLKTKRILQFVDLNRIKRFLQSYIEYYNYTRNWRDFIVACHREVGECRKKYFMKLY